MNKIKPKKHLGQHFLISKNVIEKIVDEINISQEDIIVEIGPGTGALTEEILLRNPKILYAIEIDTTVYPVLEEKFSKHSNFKLIKSDFFDVNLYELISDEEKIKLVGNLPYNVASLMIIDCGFKLDILDFCVFMIQKEVAEKLIAKPKTKDYTFLSVFIQTFFNVKYIMSVPARFFNPPPKVTSAVVKLTPKQNITIKNVKKYKNFVSHLFQNRRKMIKSKIEEEILNKVGISPNLRAEELSVEDFIRIFEVVENDDR
ncbi:16S rRNA (adenine(1518)-N(6)/adenine(1519)-N(6))-dimethyltransferase RsmA [Sulfurihydrogenibium sp.]|uniref:16S rRNA (adenine(1518)-N(6)/adenine(1519)-N(6))- dimethyltransferase RsmA n=1 Tax=Sulfurihydrogenibium sp. TaxID=2053621 RepID=UPI002601C043|nr:16S rRNA (adenine(1518)-N(6)/adenine(1519)-N(6))-dimethyltransferase RsmA [Sulfurihydrogenibium sp.]